MPNVDPKKLGSSLDRLWHEARQRQVWKGIQERAGLEQRGYRRRRIAFGALAVSVAAITVFMVGGHQHPDGEVARGADGSGGSSTAKDGPLSTRPRITTSAAEEGAEVMTLAPNTAISSTVEGAATVYQLTSGSARFRVRHREGHVVQVRVGQVTVEVVGTEFTVGALEGGGVSVEVSQGTVKTSWPGGALVLRQGDRAILPPVPDAGSVSPPTAEAAPGAVLGSHPAPDWRSLARSHDYEAAHGLLATEKVRNDDPEDLMLAADVARLSGNPGEAATYLRRVVAAGKGERVALAAFTLGRVLLGELGAPGEAAEAFVVARRRGRGPLAEDALAREVEARAKAGQTDRARALAEEYLSKYPKGARRDSVRRYGSIPSPE